MNLNELEKLAKSATPGHWDNVFGDIEQYIMVTVEGRDVYSPKNAGYIAAANPETVLKLIAVVRAAANAVYQHDCHESMDNLSRAISALEDE